MGGGRVGNVARVHSVPLSPSDAIFLSGFGTILTSLLCLSALGSVDSAASIFQQPEFVEYILSSVRLL